VKHGLAITEPYVKSFAHENKIRFKNLGYRSEAAVMAMWSKPLVNIIWPSLVSLTPWIMIHTALARIAIHNLFAINWTNSQHDAVTGVINQDFLTNNV